MKATVGKTAAFGLRDEARSARDVGNLPAVVVLHLERCSGSSLLAKARVKTAIGWLDLALFDTAKGLRVFPDSTRCAECARFVRPSAVVLDTAFADEAARAIVDALREQEHRPRPPTPIRQRRNQRETIEQPTPSRASTIAAGATC